MKSSVWLAAGLCLGLAATADAQARIRFQNMDTNGDGVITRDEWRGSDRAFRNQDWNGDGVLSGDEVRIGARRQPREVVGTSGRQDRFTMLDTNGDGRISRDEWRGNANVFNALDANGDGALTRQEALGTTTAGTNPGADDAFARIDANRDGAISRGEWRWNTAAFDRLDANRDGRLSREEFEGTAAATVPQQNAAYRAGYDRGVREGTQAGREDKPRGWDLEGQNELVNADSGYEPRLGARSDYQAGYRTGFRRGYREGFGAR